MDPFKCKTKPGPGLYDPKKSNFQSLSYTISGVNEVLPKKSRMKELSTPGPGSYSDMNQIHY